MATNKQTRVRRLSEGGPLHDLLLDVCPPNKDGVKSIPVLAQHLGLSNQCIYFWIAKDRIPAGHAKALVKASGGRVSLEKIVKFVVR